MCALVFWWRLSERGCAYVIAGNDHTLAQAVIPIGKEALHDRPSCSAWYNTFRAVVLRVTREGDPGGYFARARLGLLKGI
jgi:hypothetical protein